MNSTASVRTDDLAATLDYLDGLQVILRRFHDEGRGRDAEDALLAALQRLDTDDARTWDPLRYQTGVGQGWAHVADNVRDLRERLLEGYADAAL